MSSSLVLFTTSCYLLCVFCINIYFRDSLSDFGLWCSVFFLCHWSSWSFLRNAQKPKDIWTILKFFIYICCFWAWWLLSCVVALHQAVGKVRSVERRDDVFYECDFFDFLYNFIFVYCRFLDVLVLLYTRYLTLFIQCFVFRWVPFYFCFSIWRATKILYYL